jgi:Fe-S oxidoreductase
VPNGLAGQRVALFPGCLTDNLYPEQGAAIVESLRGLGADVVFPANLHCCGLPALNAGDTRHGRWMARQTIQALERCQSEWIVSGSASCVATLTQDYLHLFRDEPAWHDRACAIASRVLDFTRLIDQVAALPDGSLAHGRSRNLAYHDSARVSTHLGSGTRRDVSCAISWATTSSIWRSQPSAVVSAGAFRSTTRRSANA